MLRDPAPPAQDPAALALAVLGWVLADEDRAQRLIALTGIVPQELRARLDEPAVLAEVLDFVLRHEPDLIACADHLGVAPQAIARAHHALSPSDWDA